MCVHGRWAVRGVSIIAWRPDCLYLPSSKPAIPHLLVRSSPALRQQEEMGFTGSLKRTQEEEEEVKGAPMVSHSRVHAP